MDVLDDKQNYRETNGDLEEVCSHNWQNDPMFEDGAVIMFTSMQGEEMRQFCSKCGEVRYIPKETKTE